MRRMVLLTALVLASCMEAPTSSSTRNITGADLRDVPTGTPAECPAGTTGVSGTLPGSRALYLICVPAGFDPATGSLAVYAHGTVPPQEPLALPTDEVGGLAVSQIVTNILGFAYATTSYRENGLVVVDATKDLQRLAVKFREIYGPIGGDTYAVGVSEGGLIATLATERHPQLFEGTLAVCAPIGDFRRQLDYFQDFRLAFDTYFGAILAQSGIFLGSPTDIPEDVITAFGTPAQPGPLALAIAATVSNPQLWATTNALLAAADIPVQVDASNVTLITQLILRLLAYNILYTNNVQDVLGGDVFAGDQSALSHLRAMYETSGRLKSPLVTLYNINDPIVPSWNEEIYRDKVEAAGALEFLIAQIGSTQFGHCEFTLQEVLQAFGTLAQAVTGEQLAVSGR